VGLTVGRHKRRRAGLAKGRMNKDDTAFVESRVNELANCGKMDKEVGLVEVVDWDAEVVDR
jgi:hypothetical protein